MKIFIICCAHPKILYLGKILFPDISQNALGQSDCKIFKWAISQKQIDETASIIFSMLIKIHIQL